MSASILVVEDEEDIRELVRFNLGKSEGVKMGKDNWVMLGTDIPISDYKPWDAIYRFTYIKNF